MLAFAYFVQLAVMVARSFAGFVIAQAGSHVRHNLSQCLERKCMEFIKTDIEQGIDYLFGFRQRQLAQFGFDFYVFFKNTQHPSDFVEQFRLSVYCGACHALPLGFQASLLERGSNFLPRRKFYQSGRFRIFAFILGLLFFAGI